MHLSVLTSREGNTDEGKVSQLLPAKGKIEAMY